MTRWALAAVACLAACRGGTAAPVDYAREVKPLLRERCYACHGALKQKGKLRLDTVALMTAGGRSGPAVKAGDPAGSPLVARVCDPDDAARMPPEGKRLTPEQVTTLKTWVAEGAKGPAGERPEEDPAKHWAFQPVKRPAVPAPGNPVDAFLAAERRKRGLDPLPEADRATLLRRVTFDLVGLPPSPEEVRAFLADPAPDAYERVVDRLLASPQYGERWGRRWLDVWRYSDWYGRRSVPDVLNSYGQVWRWRDWTVRALNADRGYDEMVRLMLAADELAPGDDAEAVATGFLVRNFFRWNYNNWMRDNVEHTAKAFLGLTLNCCHCHDHKYDPVTKEEYFRFRAVFEPLEVRHDRWPGEADPGVYPKYSYGAAYKPITSGLVRVAEDRPEAKTHFYTGGDERNVATDRDPVAPGVPAALGGVFQVEPVALPAAAWYSGSKAFVRREEREKRELALAAAGAALATGGDLRTGEAAWTAAGSDLAALVARVAADDVVHLGAEGDPKAATEAAGRAERRHAADAARLALLRAETALAAKAGKDAAAEKGVADARAKLDAAVKALDAPVTGYTPLTHVYPAKTSSGRRAALARWITSRDNPLTARVAANHVWAGHFGRPLVETTNNFGRSGSPPSHPELLDWLAAELADNGWKMKPLHRLIVTSRAYRMSSAGAGMPAAAADPDNVFLWKLPTLRLEAEAVRDGLLAAAGELDLTAGGPEIPQGQGLTSRRRSLYLAHHGEARTEFLDLFDAANPCDGYRRTTSVLPQQALALTNSELALRTSRALAAKLPADEAFVRAAFERVLGRPPHADEAAAAAAFLARQRALPAADAAARARANLVLALFNHTDFVTIR
ncbi:MAG TPA: PSD1 and planctomycete cytochrome C domain-containing protein [Urbifossiella sp.]|nr:PSD1 and planctomycete cytochrome C domain-containing protein [Urbifossiella sp.]